MRPRGHVLLSAGSPGQSELRPRRTALAVPAPATVSVARLSRSATGATVDHCGPRGPRAADLRVVEPDRPGPGVREFQHQVAVAVHRHREARARELDGALIRRVAPLDRCRRDPPAAGWQLARSWSGHPTRSRGEA